jgi:hypothetical protein
VADNRTNVPTSVPTFEGASGENGSEGEDNDVTNRTNVPTSVPTFEGASGEDEDNDMTNMTNPTGGDDDGASGEDEQ